ncbi:MAG: four helix bundle protein [Akkermansiaceae bacterium]|nr:four helix bundle protein [Akkermansiaceae bacterium]
MTARGDEMKERTLQFSFRVGHLVNHLGRDNTLSEVYGRQLLRCASSVGANYRAACRAKSPRDFLNKLKICEEECDECVYWLQHVEHFRLVSTTRLQPLVQEASELCAMLTSACKTAARRVHDTANQ